MRTWKKLKKTIQDIWGLPILFYHTRYQQKTLLPKPKKPQQLKLRGWNKILDKAIRGGPN